MPKSTFLDSFCLSLTRPAQFDDINIVFCHGFSRKNEPKTARCKRRELRRPGSHTGDGGKRGGKVRLRLIGAKIRRVWDGFLPRRGRQDSEARGFNQVSTLS